VPFHRTAAAPLRSTPAGSHAIDILAMCQIALRLEECDMDDAGVLDRASLVINNSTVD
jgi:hypothetical protein